MKAAITVLFVAIAAAQAQTMLDGEINSGNGADLSHLTVQLQGPYPSSNRVTTNVSNGGEFRVSAITPGAYTVSVNDPQGHEVLSQTVEVSRAGGHISLEMPRSSIAPAGAGQSVSVAMLLHKPKPAAFKACLRAQKYSEGHDYGRAAAELEKAVQFDPLFAPAHGNLGAQYARLERFDRAEEELRKAIELDPATGLYYSDLAWVLSKEQQPRDAELAAKRAVDLDAANPKAQLLLGCLLAERPEARQQAVPHLIFAAREIPEAHHVLADVYHLLGNDEQSREEMLLYIETVRARDGR